MKCINAVWNLMFKTFPDAMGKLLFGSYPDVPCCCPEPLPPCSCVPLDVPVVPLYAEMTSTCGASFETTAPVELTYNGSTGCWSASGAGSGGMPTAIDAIDICCDGDEWTCQLTFIPAACGSPVTVASSGTCDPFSVTFVFTLDADCCPPGGGTLTVVVSL